MFTLRQIEVLRAIMVTGTVGGAARLLKVSAPSVSRMMKHAEGQIGFKLFSKKAGRYTPTQEARDIFHQVNGIYDKVEDLHDVVQRMKRGADAELHLDRAADDFAELGTIAEKRGLRIADEALSWGGHVNDYCDSWDVVREAAHPAVGLALDSFHIGARKTEMKSIRSIAGDKTFIAQLADAPMLEMDFLSWGRHSRSFPGQGEMPVLEFAQALQAT